MTVTEDKILTEEEIKQLLSNRKTYSELKKIGFIRDEIWMMHREIEHLKSEEMKLSADIQKKHGLGFMGYIGVIIAADAIHEEEVKRKRKAISSRRTA